MNLVIMLICTFIWALPTWTKAEDSALVKTRLLMQSQRSDGTISENRMEFVASSREEADAIVRHFVSQVNMPPEDSGDDTLVSVSRYNEETKMFEAISGP